MEFDDQTTDEVNILDANVGIGDSTPDALLDVEGTVGLGVGGVVFTAIKSTTTTWDPASTGNGANAISDVTMPSGTDAVITVVPPSNMPTCGGFGCYYTGGGIAVNSSNAYGSQGRVQLTGSWSNANVVRLVFGNASGGTVNPSSGTWTFWYIDD